MADGRALPIATFVLFYNRDSLYLEIPPHILWCLYIRKVPVYIWVCDLESVQDAQSRSQYITNMQTFLEHYASKAGSTVHIVDEHTKLPPEMEFCTDRFHAGNYKDVLAAMCNSTRLTYNGQAMTPEFFHAEAHKRNQVGNKGWQYTTLHNASPEIARYFIEGEQMDMQSPGFSFGELAETYDSPFALKDLTGREGFHVFFPYNQESFDHACDRISKMIGDNKPPAAVVQRSMPDPSYAAAFRDKRLLYVCEQIVGVTKTSAHLKILGFTACSFTEEELRQIREFGAALADALASAAGYAGDWSCNFVFCNGEVKLIALNGYLNAPYYMHEMLQLCPPEEGHAVPLESEAAAPNVYATSSYFLVPADGFSYLTDQDVRGAEVFPCKAVFRQAKDVNGGIMLHIMYVVIAKGWRGAMSKAEHERAMRELFDGVYATIPEHMKHPEVAEGWLANH